MIKVTVQYNDHLVDIHFPCSETTLRSALMEIHAADDNPPELNLNKNDVYAVSLTIND